MNLVIVESPAKAKTINKYLGSAYQVVASYGHVRDLPSKDGSVLPDEDFAMQWEADPKSAKRLSEMATAAKSADRIILATDPDREGEAISWHVLEVLKQKRVLKDKPVERVVFNAITKQAVLDAMKNPRPIDAALVDAYLARRALDYLVGFTLSPVLWRKLPGARSAGRVQSVALRLVCDRENEIEVFRPREYWSLVARLATPRGDEFDARLVGADGRKIGRLDVGNAEDAAAFRTALENGRYTVVDVEQKPARRHPFAPFTTSTLQQEASRKLGFAPNRTMQIAQRLYEGVDIGGETVGLITYMRTDGVDMAPEAVAAVRKVIGADFSSRHLPDVPRRYQVKAKNAQEAHEAIRPTSPDRRPRDVARYLDQEQAKLYELIWKRTIASQMESAELQRTSVDILAEAGGRKLDLRASGQVVTFEGFLALYNEDRDDDGDDDEGRLPRIDKGEALANRGISATQHFTEPPPRYSEATLVKRMEELGIGRPSTYAATLGVLRDRGYVRLEKKKLFPEDKGRLVTAFLQSFFSRYVEYDFTADLEGKLDQISAGDIAWKDVLREFWQQFSFDVSETKELRVAQVLDALNELLGPHIFPERADGGDPRACPACGNGKLSLKLGKFGAFIGCSNYPECRYTRQLAVAGEDSAPGEGGEDGAKLGADGVRVLGKDPETGLDVTLRSGRFGVYVQLGEGEGKEKPKRSSLPKGWEAATLDLDRALALLALPREVGAHPEDGKPIQAGLGRYGPFVLHDGKYANLDSIDEVFSVGINRAVSVLAEKQARGPRAGRAGAEPLKTLGDHPTLGGPVTVHAGRYGPYVKHGAVNATIPKGTAPEAVSMETAVALIAERAGKTPVKAPRAARKATGEDGAAKKAPAKKAAAKSTTAKASTAKASTAKAATARKAPAKKAPAKKAAEA
ncbi:type I DNA topoisomerase [Kaistia geumhonensis]|uniref:DNA topoisomerase 1 n=1 Tax=Kaistia geumhonensis TaxID=410839 RepID=A0ABU0MAT4_9HYPH|nr:type I DNA topoisomerase [Kaistia geumhonensis]MCX5481007.1 type I DNA topoisomerase [Kaistia geumhonensis]MDQ0518064.1 DNA topoisomerase-1 [Kaistia geumhonensis]